MSLYTSAAYAALRWEMAQAKGVRKTPCPQMCLWYGTDLPGDKEVRTGVGQGVAGIAYTFDVFAERTGNPMYEQYALGAAAFLESHITAAGAIPEHPTTEFDTGYLNGSAGDAFVFLRLYQHTHQARYLSSQSVLESFTWSGKDAARPRR